MPRTGKGKDIHKKLVDFTVADLQRRGYKRILREVKVGDKRGGGKIDLLTADRERPIIIAECLVRPTKTVIQDKIERYREHGDKIVVVIPKSERTFELDGVTYWKAPFELEKAVRLSADLPVETYNRFAKKCIDVDKRHVEVIRELIGSWIGVGSWAIGSWGHET